MQIHRRSIVALTLLLPLSGLAGCMMPTPYEGSGPYRDFDMGRPNTSGTKVFPLPGGKFIVIDWEATVLEGHAAPGGSFVGYGSFSGAWQSTSSLDFDQNHDGISFALPGGTRIDRIESGGSVAGCSLSSSNSYSLRIVEGVNLMTWSVVRASDGATVMQETFAVPGGFPNASLSVQKTTGLLITGAEITVDYKGAIAEFHVQ